MEADRDMFYFDPVYLLFALPGILLSAWASIKTHMTFSHYSEVPASTGLSGAEAAARLLSNAGIRDVKIEETDGFLSDHYDPLAKTLRLSPKVYEGRSLSAIGVACHEAGHALQHAAAYFPMHIRSAIVPVYGVSTWLSYIVIAAGFFMSAPKLILAGAILFSAAVLFTLVTLPVEWDASARAKKLMVSNGVVSEKEAVMAGEVLNAAFLTYVAAAISSILTLLYYLMRAGVFSNRSSDD